MTCSKVPYSYIATIRLLSYVIYVRFKLHFASLSYPLYPIRISLITKYTYREFALVCMVRIRIKKEEYEASMNTNCTFIKAILTKQF